MADYIESIIQSYTTWFGTPSKILRFDINAPPLSSVALVIYLPVDSDANTTLIGTAGLSSANLVEGFKAEFGIEVKGTFSDSNLHSLGKALVNIGLAPLKTRRLFEENQILNNFEFPFFPRFGKAMLVNLDPVYSFEFPGIDEPTTLLMVVPIFEDEVKYIESSKKREETYLQLYNRGLIPEDFDRTSMI